MSTYRKPAPVKRVRFFPKFVKWLGRGAALYALLWFGMKYIGYPWLGWSMLWSFLIVAGIVVILGLWGDTEDLETNY